MVRDGNEAAIFPLAMPSIAGPGAILTVVLLTENARVCVLEQAIIVAVMLVVLAFQMALLLGAGGIHRLIGDAGASVVSRIMGMLLATVATTHVDRLPRQFRIVAARSCRGWAWRFCTPG
jgi:multiple antibiotic resistance protein